MRPRLRPRDLRLPLPLRLRTIHDMWEILDPPVRFENVRVDLEHPAFDAHERDVGSRVNISHHCPVGLLGRRHAAPFRTVRAVRAVAILDRRRRRGNRRERDGFRHGVDRSMRIAWYQDKAVTRG